MEDTITIEVYDDACKAAIGAGKNADNPGDLNANCITGLEDLAEMVSTWLNDTGLTEPVSLTVSSLLTTTSASAGTGTISFVPITGDADSGTDTEEFRRFFEKNVSNSCLNSLPAK